MTRTWQIWIDTGGTFTDCIASAPDGTWRRAKVLSSSAVRGRVVEWLDMRRARIDALWATFDDCVRGLAFRTLPSETSAGTPIVRNDARVRVIELATPISGTPSPGLFEACASQPAPVLAAHLVTGTPPGAPLPPLELRLATTRGTNALLERRGARVAFVTTAGFGDLLEIGDQQRPDLFALDIRRPSPLAAATLEIAERMDPDGTPRSAPDLDEVRAAGRALVARGIRIAAVALKHAYRNAAHEHAVAAALRDAGLDTVVCSADVAPLIGLLARAETTVVEAYLAPIITTYLQDVTNGAGTHPLVMTSAGGLVPANAYGARDSLLSGPAGGVVGAVAAGRDSGGGPVIGFDMGGTSTDVARCGDGLAYLYETRIAGVRVMAPTLDINTVAAGGGSVCRYADGQLAVGPESAGAVPGPACYGAGGPLTLTDVNLLLGRLDPGHFEIPVSPERAREALATICDAVADDRGARPDPDELLEGFLVIANERMADAIRAISVARGIDPATHTLIAFGGAGGQHACAVAAHLEIDRIVFPADAALLSARGLGAAAVERFAHAQVLQTLDDPALALPARLAALESEARRRLAADGAVPADSADPATRVRRLVDLRLIGQDAALTVDADDVDTLPARFAALYVERYGHTPPARPIEVAAARVVVSLPARAVATPAARGGDSAIAPARRSARFDGDRRDVTVHLRDALAPGTDVVTGPALVVERRSTFVIEPGWTAQRDTHGAIVASRVRGASVPSARPTVVAAELFTNRLGAVAREMGEMLQRTALSTNVKERLDFSCAILDAGGRLLVHAPHVPVHLGALGLCVRAVRAAIDLGPGDVAVTNHPAYGGSHLPDVTVITPVHDDAGTLVAHLASRAHHAEIGGLRPGSMPPGATRLGEEGVVLSPMLVQRAGVFDPTELERRLRAAPHPSRAPRENLADIAAQMAANHRGAGALRELAATMGVGAMRQAMDAMTARAERLVRGRLAAQPDGVRSARQSLDDGTTIAVTITIAGDEMRVDFSGTSDVHPENLNATPAIAHSAVLYAIRVLLDLAHRDVPLNEGLLEPIEIILPEGLLNPRFPADPAHAPAVVGGNVETSQRLVDTLLLALTDVACSQGTMNNVVFGTEAFGYYETVGGGSGAGPGFDGASAVQVHMTNTRITDPEILEHRYPVELETFAVRRGSGGAGRHRGGDGLVRTYRFLTPMALSILAQRRSTGPEGRAGGVSGATGRQTLIRAAGGESPLPGIVAVDVATGDRLRLETPGGGGWGRATDSTAGSSGPSTKSAAT